MKSIRNAVLTLALSTTVFAVTGCGSSSDNLTGPGLDNAPPAAPTGVAVQHDGQLNQDDLMWEPSASANVAGYEVHRYSAAPSGNEVGEVVILVSNEQTSLRLPLVNEDRTEVYRVRAVSSSNVAGAFSGQAVANRYGWERADLPTDGPGGRTTEGID